MLVLPIFNEKIQNYVSLTKHLNIMHYVKMTIVTPKVNHSTMNLGSQFATFGLNVVFHGVYTNVMHVNGIGVTLHVTINV
jgi:hypothetical protein